MFRSEKRQQEQERLALLSFVSDLQRWLVSQMRPELIEEYGDFLGGQLAQTVVDKLFARPLALRGSELELSERLAIRALCGSENLRDLTIHCLRLLRDEAVSHNNAKAIIRIDETLRWAATMPHGQETAGEIQPTIREAA